MSKEIIKENVVAAPTLFIGVGGTGCNIVKRVAEKCRPGEKENINFVCLDTNVNDLSDIAKSSAHIYYVQTSNTQTVGDYLDYDQDALKNWFPKNAVMYDKTVSEGAGQVRAISRLALNATIKTGKLKPLYDAIDDLFRKDGKALKQAMRIVIASTASGGTGSGIILPLSMIVRDYVNTKYPNTSLIVRSVILLPETLDSVIDSTAERESQRRNAYATIKEINAFMMKGSGFMDVGDSDLSRYKDLHIDFANPGTNELKRLSLLPFDFCFLMDGQNAEDTTMANLEQYKAQAAQALYEQNIGPMQANAFSVEDNIIKEMSNPGNLGRNRFGGIGAGVIRYPYEDIADYIAYGWAMDSIGGEGDVAKWSKYDHAYDVAKQDAIKKGLSQSEIPTRGEVYTGKLRTATDNFSKDLNARFLNDADKRIKNFFKAVDEEMIASLSTDSAIRATRDAANALATEIDYEDENNRGHAVENKDKLRNYEAMLRSRAKKVAANAAEALFMNENKTINEKRPCTLEFLLKNAFGEVCHPNAARYMLYQAKIEMDKRVRTTTSTLHNVILPRLELYAPDAYDTGMFDHEKTKRVEANLDDLCSAEQDPDKRKAIPLFSGGDNKFYEKLNELFPDYHKHIREFGECTAKLEAYTFGSEYLDDLCKMYESFFFSFGDKVQALERRQDDMVDALKFRKGDSTYNVCATRDLLNELVRSTAHQSEEGSMLESDLNGQIFDAVKSNVSFDREIRNADIVENDRSIDIFDDILLGYFKKDVRRRCDAIDVNIIEAIALENRLLSRLKMREEMQDSSKKLIDKVTNEDNVRHICEVIAMGERLAAPSIQRLRNEEAREVKLSAYNKSLLDMRAYRITDLLPKGSAVDTISRYELHFFNALYNLTPDKLSKFSCYSESETGVKNAGLYHNAYVTYSRNIGPDSTKNSLISTHIDKRWDSLSAMPELDFGFQERQMMKIHQALIYGLIHKVITYRFISTAAGGKKVYKYENSDERYVDMIVSNGTLCDEFYEILDSLYISPAVVEDMEKIKEKKRARDKVRNSNYAGTTFAKDLAEFHLDILHDGETSLFEIPIAYYNSLPSSLRFVNEISGLVNAVIQTFKDELAQWENPNDAKFLLCDLLKKQFMLMVNNFEQYETLNRGGKVSENPVIDIIYRRVRASFSTAPEPDDYEQALEEMRARLR